MEGWFFATAALLVVSGIGKLVDPTATAGALRTARLPDDRFLVRVLGLAELGVGVGNLLWSSFLLAWMQTGLYLAFGLFVLWALSRRLPLASCGCFGKPDTPPTWLHVLINGTAVIGGGFHAMTGAQGLGSILAEQPLAGLPYVGFVGLGAYCLYLLLGELPLLRTIT